MNQFEQGLLTYLSQDQIDTIQSKHIGIAGCGGLGSNASLMLTRCGFKYFTLLDFDTVEASNLNRQQYTLKDIGELKTQCLSKKMHKINPNADCRIVNTKWQENLTKNPFHTCDILIEAFDQAASKSALINHYSDKIEYIVSGNGMAGISGPLFQITQHGNIFIVGDGISDTENGAPPLAPRVITCAAMIAQQVLELALK